MQAITNTNTLAQTVQRAIDAGVDIVLFGNNLEYDPYLAQNIHKTIVQLVQQGSIPQARIVESYNRIMKLKKTLRAKK